MSETIDCVEFCRALADDTRQRMLELLLERELSVSEIVERFQLSQPTVSHHLDTLRRYGLLASRRQGKHIYYRTRREQVVRCCGLLFSKYATGQEIRIDDKEAS